MLKIHFVDRPWNPISATIKWATPISRLRWSPTSHCIAELDGVAYHSTMLHGVIAQNPDRALKPYRLIKTSCFNLYDEVAAIVFARAQVGAPYDWMGAFGMFFSPLSRDWQKNDAWSCSELPAAILMAGGRTFFENTGHVSPTMLMMLQGDH